MLTGTPPFAADSVVLLLLKVINEEVEPLRSRLPSIPPDLDTIVMKCLNKEPGLRYGSAQDFADDLGRYVASEAIFARRLGLLQCLRKRARKHRALVSLAILSLLLVSGLGINQLRLRARAAAERTLLAEQARIERELGQQMKDMEWLLHGARQQPLHNLNREKRIIRKRMQTLQQSLSGSGPFGRSLAHYALGRGHLALHEYPQALEQLRQSIELGNRSAEVHYALGLVLGKCFEQAMAEARLAGGGDWAKQQLGRLRQPRRAAAARLKALA